MKERRVMEGHILVVEHDDRLRIAICMFLDRAGFGVRSTTTVDGAMAQLSRVPSLIVIDLALPGGNAIQILREVRAIGLPTDIAVIASGWDAAVNQTMGVLQVDAIFGKPFDFQDFADWLFEEFGVLRAFADNLHDKRPPREELRHVTAFKTPAHSASRFNGDHTIN